MKKWIQRLAFVTATGVVGIGTVAVLPTSQISVQAATETEQVMAQVEDALNTSLPVTLPHKIPVTSGKHLTAKTSVSKNYYKVVFYETSNKVPVNAKKLATVSKKVVARIQMERYATKAEALSHVNYLDYSKYGGQEVALTHGITGYQDAGAGQLYTGWNEGRWALATHTYTDQNAVGVAMAKDTVNYLETHMLPVPDRYGYIQLNAVGDGHFLSLQKGTSVMTIDKVATAKTLLEIATSVR